MLLNAHVGYDNMSVKCRHTDELLSQTKTVYMAPSARALVKGDMSRQAAGYCCLLLYIPHVMRSLSVKGHNDSWDSSRGRWMASQ